MPASQDLTDGCSFGAGTMTLRQRRRLSHVSVSNISLSKAVTVSRRQAVPRPHTLQNWASDMCAGKFSGAKPRCTQIAHLILNSLPSIGAYGNEQHAQWRARWHESTRHKSFIVFSALPLDRPSLDSQCDLTPCYRGCTCVLRLRQTLFVETFIHQRRIPIWIHPTLIHTDKTAFSRKITPTSRLPSTMGSRCQFRSRNW